MWFVFNIYISPAKGTLFAWSCDLFAIIFILYYSTGSIAELITLGAWTLSCWWVRTHSFGAAGEQEGCVLMNSARKDRCSHYMEKSPNAWEWQHVKVNQESGWSPIISVIDFYHCQSQWQKLPPIVTLPLFLSNRMNGYVGTWPLRISATLPSFPPN